MNEAQMKDFLLQALEHELGGVQVYEMALKCAMNRDLRKEWERYHRETQNHVRLLTDACASLGIDAQQQTPGRTLVQKMGQMLVAAMNEARTKDKPEAAEIVACECVTLAEIKDHMNWELIGKCAQKLGAQKGQALRSAFEEVEDQEDEHFYHTRGWARELWIQALGMPAVLPPPEEEKNVKSAIAAARAEKESERGRFH